jgi:hypothetical protein
MAKPFNDLLAKHVERKQERYRKVVRWLELETEHREGRMTAFTQRHYEKLALEKELFGEINDVH